MQTHPFEWIHPGVRLRVFVVTALAAALLMVALQISGAPLKTAAAPLGIISFEFAGSLERAQAMVVSWQPAASAWAGFNLGLDYLFLIAYAWAIGLGCVLVATKLHETGVGGDRLLVVLAWGLLLAATLDAVENFALLQVLLGAQWPGWPPLAAWCAGPKFALVLLGFLGMALGGLLLTLKRFKPLAPEQDPNYE
jgi:hypothetical protein